MAYRAFTSFTGSFNGFLRCERGGGTIMGLLWFILLVGITGLAVDITDANRTETMLQATADAAAHAAVQDLPDEAAAVASALIYTEKNMLFAQHGVILRAADVQIGVWDPATRELTLGSGEEPNAVLVTLRRTAANGNALPLNFLQIVGVLGTDDLNSWDITTQAVAMAGVHHCLRGGFVAAQRVLSDSTNDYVEGICIHGQEGVTIGSTNYFEPGVGVTMEESATTFVQGVDNIGIDNALSDRNYLPPLPGQMSAIVLGLMNRTLEPPDYIVAGRPTLHVQTLPQNPSKDVFYVVTDAVVIHPGASINGIAVVSLESIVISSDATITNAFFGSVGNITLGSSVYLSNVTLASNSTLNAGLNNQYGSSTYCNDGVGEVHIFAVESITLGSFSTYSGAQIVSNQTVSLGSNLFSLVGIAVQAGQDIIWGNAGAYGGCAAPTDYNPETSVYIVN